MPTLPEARGPVSSWLLDRLAEPPTGGLEPAPTIEPDAVLDDDAQLALTVAHGLAYEGWDGVSDRWETHPTLVSALNQWEEAFTSRLAVEVGDLGRGDVVDWLVELATPAEDAASTSTWLLEHGELWHLREEAVLRSLYQRKEADPHTFGIPRLRGPAKVALVEIQADEYGDGRLRDMHSELFGQTMEGLGLDTAFGAWIDHLPAEALATVNLVECFARQRRWRGALVGHLALFEMASVPVMSAMSRTYRRLGCNDWTTLFFDVHVVADAEHQALASHGMVAPLLEAEPDLETDVRFGAATLGLLEGRLTRRVLGAWREGRTALRRPLDEAPDDLPALRDVPVATDPRDRAEPEVPQPA